MAAEDYSMNRTRNFQLPTAVPNEPADYSVDDVSHSFDIDASNSLPSSPESDSVPSRFFPPIQGDVPPDEPFDYHHTIESLITSGFTISTLSPTFEQLHDSVIISLLFPSQLSHLPNWSLSTHDFTNVLPDLLDDPDDTSDALYQAMDLVLKLEVSPRKSIHSRKCSKTARRSVGGVSRR